MRKNSSFAGHALRLIAAASLACTVATVGCSTDRNPGAGEPQRYAPSVGPTNPSSTPGSEQNRPVNPPMTSTTTNAAACANNGAASFLRSTVTTGGIPSSPGSGATSLSRT